MQTLTIEVPEGFADAARERGKSMEDLSRQVLVEWLAETNAEARDVQIAEERWAEIESGAVEGLDWEAVKAEWDALPD